MRFRVERDVLAEAVAWAARSLPTRPPVPVLAGLLVEAGPDGLALSGFDYEVSARVTIDADVPEPGRALVSGRLLADICRSLPPRTVEVVSEGSKVVVTCGSSRFSLLTLPVEEYPALPQMPSASGSLPAEVFAAAVSQVSVAAGRDDTLPVLTGVRVEIEGERITLAATDRYRLAVRELTWKPEQAGLSAVALVPARTLADSARSLSSGDDVLVALASPDGSENLVGFEGGTRRVTTRLLDGEFPKYQALLPAESASVAVVETGALVDAVKRVALVAERNTPVRLSFTDGAVTLEAGSGDDAQASETLEAQLEGDEIAIAFNPGYLLDGLGALDAAYAQLSFTTPTKPAVLSGRATADAEPSREYRYLLMPVRLSGV
ncbi:DNA polymerase III beta subunit [Motilibacter rhizosphaerae]|uniref:Beta sliding clamp n=1 Tax=Motilibacter rhizosphaerae TaxID=598652 RepID=A0A4Q7NW49_9ACTN|nr:DNA polymerase III subunit beta [Motilibacter rhizosphaerae]RZS91230.1 DNA polymerase III beta subunit [Motilibacter rhizosphaerae]